MPKIQFRYPFIATSISIALAVLAPSASAQSIAQPAQLSDADLSAQSKSRMQALKAKRSKQQYGGGALNSMDPETRSAWKRWSSDSYGSSAAAQARKKRDFLRLQRDWGQVQAEAHKGFISAEDNSRFLREHSADMKRRMTRAGEKHNLGVSLQDASGPQKTYSDVDGHGRPVWRNQDKSAGKAGEMSVEQFVGARNDFNRQFNDDLRAAGLATVDNPAAEMRSDLMPITDDPRLFQAVEGHINPDGGVMYQDPKAVRQEVLNRQFDEHGNRLGDATDADTKAAYLQEQIRQQRSHADESRHLIEDANRVLKDPNASDADKRKALRKLEQAQGEGSSLIGKYEERANTVVNQAAKNSGGDGIQVSDKRQQAIDAVGKRRDHTVTQQSADLIATSENAIRNQQAEGVKTMMRDGEIGAAAEIARNADANTRGQVVEQARNASRERWERVVREQGIASDPDEVRRIAGKLADRDAGQLAREMARNADKDMLVRQRIEGDGMFVEERTRWQTNSKSSTLKSDGMEVLKNSSKAELLDGKRPAFVDTPNDVAVIGKGGKAKVTKIDNANPKPGTNVGGAVMAGVETGLQVGDATARQLGKVLDRDDQSVTAGDLAAIAGEGVGYTPLVQGIEATRKQNALKEVALDTEINKLLHKKEALTREEQARLQSLIEQANNADSVTATVSTMGQQMLVEPNKEIIGRRMQEMRAQARAEGREAEFLRDGIPAMAKIGAEVIGNMTGMNTAASMESEISTFDERADWSAQRGAMIQYVNQNAMWADKRANAMIAQLDPLLLGPDLADPATQARVSALLAGIASSQARIGQLVAMADSQLADVAPDKLAMLRGIARSQRDLAALRDYANQMIAAAVPRQTAQEDTQDQTAAGKQDEQGWGDAGDSGWGDSNDAWGGGEFAELASEEAATAEAEAEASEIDFAERERRIARARALGESQRYSDRESQVANAQRRAGNRAQLNALAGSLMGTLAAANAAQAGAIAAGSSYPATAPSPTANASTAALLQQMSGGPSARQSGGNAARTRPKQTASGNCPQMQSRVIAIDSEQRQLMSVMKRASSRAEQQRIGTRMESLAREQSGLGASMMGRCAKQVDNRTTLTNQQVIDRSQRYGGGQPHRSRVHEDATILGQ